MAEYIQSLEGIGELAKEHACLLGDFELSQAAELFTLFGELGGFPAAEIHSYRDRHFRKKQGSLSLGQRQRKKRIQTVRENSEPYRNFSPECKPVSLLAT